MISFDLILIYLAINMQYGSNENLILAPTSIVAEQYPMYRVQTYKAKKADGLSVTQSFMLSQLSDRL